MAVLNFKTTWILRYYARFDWSKTYGLLCRLTHRKLPPVCDLRAKVFSFSPNNPGVCYASKPIENAAYCLLELMLQN